MSSNSSNGKKEKVEIKMASWCFQLRLGVSVSLPVLDKSNFILWCQTLKYKFLIVYGLKVFLETSQCNSMFTGEKWPKN